MAQIHLSEAEVSGNFAAVLRWVADGEDVVVDREGQSVAIIGSLNRTVPTVSELIDLAAKRESDRGFAVTLDEDFGADMEKIVSERKPWTHPSWDRSSIAATSQKLNGGCRLPFNSWNRFDRNLVPYR
jgi:hypothetical protein